MCKKVHCIPLYEHLLSHLHGQVYLSEALLSSGQQTGSVGLLQILEGCCEVSRQPSPSWTAPTVSACLTNEVYAGGCSPLRPLWPPVDLLHVLPMLEAPELDAGFQVGSPQSRAKGQNPFPCPAGHAALDPAQDAAGFLDSARGWAVLSSSSSSTPKSF